MDKDLEESFKKLMGHLKRAEVAEGKDKASAEEIPKDLGEAFSLAGKRGSFKLEQNLGCELPVCVANRREANREAIECDTGDGVIWRLVRTADSRLPAPDHYVYWLWFLDRCQAAAESGLAKPPRIVLDPPEIFDLFGTPRGTTRGHSGRYYDVLDDAFLRFSNLVISQRTAFHQRGALVTGLKTSGTLCSYESWRTKPVKAQQVLSFAQGWISPGPLLWQSIQTGYIKSVPLAPLKELDYVGQRLLTYLFKHCQPSGNFTIAVRKLLPRIPLVCAVKKAKSYLAPHHEALAKQGFLADVQFEGRGEDRLVTYCWTKKSQKRPYQSPWKTILS